MNVSIYTYLYLRLQQWQELPLPRHAPLSQLYLCVLFSTYPMWHTYTHTQIRTHTFICLYIYVYIIIYYIFIHDIYYKHTQVCRCCTCVLLFQHGAVILLCSFSIQGSFSEIWGSFAENRSLFPQKSPVFQPTPCKTHKIMQICIYICIYIYWNIYIYTYIYMLPLYFGALLSTNSTWHSYTYVYIYIYIYTYIYVYVYVYVCIYNIIAMGLVCSFFIPPHMTQVHICIHIHTYI